VSDRAQIGVDLAVGCFMLCICGVMAMFGMPGEPYEGELPSLTGEQRALRERLREHVETIAGEYPHRDVQHMDQYRAARDYIRAQLETAGYEPELERFEVRGRECANVVVERAGGAKSEEIVVVGAHYDAVPPSPGADDNASGVAGLLALARHFADGEPDRTLRFVFFANEEAPHFHTDAMGSLRHARQARADGEQIVAMISLEMLGYYTTESGRQQYPPLLGWIYPDRGDFIGFVGNLSSRQAVKRAIGAFRDSAEFPSYGFAGPGFAPGVSLSDHWSFWEVGYPALMVTDTAYNRNPHYHRPTDTPETLDYGRFARVVDGLEDVVGEFADDGAL